MRGNRCLGVHSARLRLCHRRITKHAANRAVFMGGRSIGTPVGISSAARFVMFRNPLPGLGIRFAGRGRRRQEIGNRKMSKW